MARLCDNCVYTLHIHTNVMFCFYLFHLTLELMAGQSAIIKLINISMLLCLHVGVFDLSSRIFNVKTVKNNLSKACLCSLVWYHIRYGRFVCASFTKNTHRHYHYPRNILRLTICIWISNNRKFSFKLSTQTDVQTKIHSQLTNANISTYTHKRLWSSGGSRLGLFEWFFYISAFIFENHFNIIKVDAKLT